MLNVKIVFVFLFYFWFRELVDLVLVFLTQRENEFYNSMLSICHGILKNLIFPNKICVKFACEKQGISVGLDGLSDMQGKWSNMFKDPSLNFFHSGLKALDLLPFGLIVPLIGQLVPKCASFLYFADWPIAKRFYFSILLNHHAKFESPMQLRTDSPKNWSFWT